MKLTRDLNPIFRNKQRKTLRDKEIWGLITNNSEPTFSSFFPPLKLILFFSEESTWYLHEKQKPMKKEIKPNPKIENKGIQLNNRK